MIIEPTPTNPRSRRGRATRLVGIILPPALLVAVVGGGLLGRSATPPSPAPTQVAVATADVPVASPAPQQEPLVDGDLAAFPTLADDLPVHSITEALAILTAGGPSQVVVVKGFLGLLASTGTCVDPTEGPLGPLCERRGVLTEQPWVSDGAGAVQAFSAHLHARLPVGVRLPDDAVGATPTGRGQVRVVVIGRFEGGGDTCRPIGPVCGPGFEVDAVAWHEGASFPSSPVVDAGIDSYPMDWILIQQDAAEAAAIGPSGTILYEALVRVETIARVDPVAAAALATRKSVSGLVWYVRGLETGYDPAPFPLDESPPPHLTWVILDNASGTVLARSPAATG